MENDEKENVDSFHKVIKIEKKFILGVQLYTVSYNIFSRGTLYLHCQSYKSNRLVYIR